MKRWVRNIKRSLAFLLAAAMIVTMMPQTALQASASEDRAETETEASADNVEAEISETGGGKSCR